VVSGSLGFAGCGAVEDSSGGSTVSMPATRVVMFASDDGSFTEGHIWPTDPTDVENAWVLVEQACDGVATCTWLNDIDSPLKGCASEWYGVPHAVTYTDGDTVDDVVLYVTWKGVWMGDDTYAPSRIRGVYPHATYDYSAADYDHPPWAPGALSSGLSCFKVDKESLKRKVKGLVEGSAASSDAHSIFTYIGEAIVTDGAQMNVPDLSYGLDTGIVPKPLEVIDPHLYQDGEALVLAFNDHSPNQCRLRTAKMATVGEVDARMAASAGGEPHTYIALAANIIAAYPTLDPYTDAAASTAPLYTVFLTPDSVPTCDPEFDMRQLLLNLPPGQGLCALGFDGDLGLLLSDQDVAILDPETGCRRVSFFCQGLTDLNGRYCLSQGLVHAIKGGGAT
jgi:hypothetical protein